MSEPSPSSGSPWGREFDDRKVHATGSRDDTFTDHRKVRTEEPPGATGPGQEPRTEPEPPFEGPLGALSEAAWQVILLTGGASLILGILVLIWPEATLLAVGVLFGIYLVVSGIFQLVAAFGTHKSTSLRILAVVSGALSILLGLFCFRGPMQSILLLGLWIGIGWLIRGITQTLAAASDSRMPARGWHAFLGVVTFIAGIVLIDSPFRSVAVLTLLGGWWLVAVGIVEIITAFRVRGRATKQQEAHL